MRDSEFRTEDGRVVNPLPYEPVTHRCAPCQVLAETRNDPGMKDVDTEGLHFKWRIVDPLEDEDDDGS